MNDKEQTIHRLSELIARAEAKKDKITHRIRPVRDKFDRATGRDVEFLKYETGFSWRMWQRFNRDWFLDRSGSMLHCSGYMIPNIRVNEGDWVLHLMAKVWFDANTFLPAWMEALRRHGDETVLLRVK